MALIIITYIFVLALSFFSGQIMVVLKELDRFQPHNIEILRCYIVATFLVSRACEEKNEKSIKQGGKRLDEPASYLV